MKIIDFETIKQSAQNMDSSIWIDWVDYALRNKESFCMPPKIRLSQDNGDYYNIMPVMYEKENVSIVKMIGRHVIKPGEAQRSIMNGDMLVYEADTGILKALMDAEYITTLRTGAVAAHSALLFAKKNFKTIGLIGLGNIMTVCFMTMINKMISNGDERPLAIKLYRHNGQEERFKNRFKGYSNLTFIMCDTYEDVIKDSDLVISAVTKATENFADDYCYKEGVTIVPICTMGFQNCDLFFDKVFTDEIEQITGFKYFNQFKSIANVTDVLEGTAIGRERDSERIIVYDYGIGIHDLFFAMKLYSQIDGRDVEYNYCKEKFFI